MRWARVNHRIIAGPVIAALRTEGTLVRDSVHNHVSVVEDLWLHRKGAAVPVRSLVPLAGSRDDCSFLLAADPGPEALSPLCHGAIRRYDHSSMHGRIRKVCFELEALTRNRFGGQLLCADHDLPIEEAGHAYKPVTSVLGDLKAFGLARRLVELTPVLTFKMAGGAA